MSDADLWNEVESLALDAEIHGDFEDTSETVGYAEWPDVDDVPF